MKIISYQKTMLLLIFFLSSPSVLFAEVVNVKVLENNSTLKDFKEISFQAGFGFGVILGINGIYYPTNNIGLSFSRIGGSLGESSGSNYDKSDIINSNYPNAKELYLSTMGISYVLGKHDNFQQNNIQLYKKLIFESYSYKNFKIKNITVDGLSSQQFKLLRIGFFSSEQSAVMAENLTISHDTKRRLGLSHFQDNIVTPMHVSGLYIGYGFRNIIRAKVSVSDYGIFKISESDLMFVDILFASITVEEPVMNGEFEYNSEISTNSIGIRAYMDYTTNGFMPANSFTNYFSNYSIEMEFWPGHEGLFYLGVGAKVGWFK